VSDVAVGKKGKSLKRPGSPNLSESSGNESSRKKVKKHANSGSVRPSRSSTPLPGQPPRTKILKSGSSTGTGALSDGEATGGEMSDGAASGKRRIKIVGAGARSTPSGSRASSPNPTNAGPLSPGSNSGSPGRAGSPGSPASRAASPSAGGSMDAQEIIAALRKIPEGITVGGLLKQFGSRIGDGPNQMKRKDWIKLVKENSVFGEDKLLRAKTPGSD
jgi:transcription initiation factor TFIIF subunit alpha